MAHKQKHAKGMIISRPTRRKSIVKIKIPNLQQRFIAEIEEKIKQDWQLPVGDCDVIFNPCQFCSH